MSEGGRIGSRWMEPVFDVPVAADGVRQLGGVGLFGGQGGHGVGGLGAPPAGAGPAAAHDLDGLGGVWEQDARADGGDNHGAGLGPAVTTVAGPGRDGHVGPWQAFELGVEVWLVAFDGQHVVRTPAVEVVSRGPLRVQRVGGDNHACHLERVEQDRQLGTSLVFAYTSTWASTTPWSWSSAASR